MPDRRVRKSECARVRPGHRWPLRTPRPAFQEDRAKRSSQSGSRPQSERAWSPFPVASALDGLLSKAHGIEPLGIEHHQQVVLELVRPPQQRAMAPFKNGGIGLIIGGRDGEHLAY